MERPSGGGDRRLESRRLDRQNVALAMNPDALRRVSQKQARHAATTDGSQCDQVGLHFLCEVYDLLRWIAPQEMALHRNVSRLNRAKVLFKGLHFLLFNPFAHRAIGVI